MLYSQLNINGKSKYKLIRQILNNNCQKLESAELLSTFY